MSTDTQFLTAEKFTELEKELAMLKTERRKEVAEHLEYSKKLGDLSENAEYHQAREEQAEVEDRIARVEQLLKNAQIVKHEGNGIVTIGAVVRLEKKGDNKSLLITLVGSEEADMTRGKISNLSPLGAALIGHKLGDKVHVPTPKGTAEYVVAAIK